MITTTSTSPLTTQELTTINGGSLLGDLAYCVGVAAKSLVHFAKTAAEFQASLPPNLKK